MFQKLTTWLVIGILGLTPFLGAASPAVAQSESGFTDEIVVDDLASGEIPNAVTAPGTLTLERIVMPADSGLPVRQVPDGELLYVEQGTLTIADGLGLSSQLEAEKSVHLRAGSSYTAINDDRRDVAFLRLTLDSSSATATPIAQPSMPEPEVSDSIEITTLAAFALTAVPESPTTLFLSRATWGAGVDSGEYTQNGPIGMYTESGMLTISSPSGIDGQLEEGQAVLLPADQVLRTRNDGTSNAVALVFGVIPAGGPAVTAMAEPVITSSGSGGEDAPTTAAGTVLYRADTTTGFEDWPGAGGWVTVQGMLVNDGSSDSAEFVGAPFQPSMTDYAVEVEMQWVRNQDCCSTYSFGIVAREGDTGGYRAGYITEYRSDRTLIRLWGADDDDIARSELTIDNEWHTYRLEVQGNSIRVIVDGMTVIETTDNSFLSPGQVGLWSRGTQVNVRSFMVTALGDG